MPTDTKLNQLIINQLTQEQYDEAKAAGTLSDTELYITDSDDEAQVKSNLSQTIDDSTTKYPSNKAVKDESSRITTLMDNYVKKSGDTMTGDFIIEKNSEGILVIRSLTRDSAVNPEIWGAFGLLEFRDKNNVLTGLIENWQHEDGRMHILMRVINRGNSAQILLGAKTDGSFYTECPASNNNNSIVTTVSYGSNYVRFGNGLQICWFYPQISGSVSNYTLTLPVAFKDNNYLALIQQTGDSPSNEYTNTLSIMGKTTTNFAIKKVMVETMYLQVLCVGYWY